MTPAIHIVAFNVPCPADYGGVIDVYYRLRALSQLGLRVTLHCFTYGRAAAPELESLCEKVYYYRRDMSPLRLLARRPFIVASRHSDLLLQRLSADDHPVLIEGVHGCLMLEGLRSMERERQLPHKTVVVRAHNVEQNYYKLLAQGERRLLKRLYLSIEAGKLRRYERRLTLADAVVAVTDDDTAFFKALGCRSVATVPVFHPEDDQRPGDEVRAANMPALPEGPYALLHGDLSVADNIWAVHRLLSYLADMPYRFVVAGRNPDSDLRRAVARHDNVLLIASPDDATMETLQRNAQCIVLFSRQATGFKVKLMTSLMRGRHCIANSAMVAGSGLGTLCHVADSADGQRRLLQQLMETPFDEGERKARLELLSREHDNAANAQRIARLLIPTFQLSNTEQP